MLNESDSYVYQVNFIWLLRYRFHVYRCINFTEEDCIQLKRIIILCIKVLYMLISN